MTKICNDYKIKSTITSSVFLFGIQVICIHVNVSQYIHKLGNYSENYVNINPHELISICQSKRYPTMRKNLRIITSHQ